MLNSHAPIKKKNVRANHAPYMSNVLRKAIMKMGNLEDTYRNSSTIKRFIENKKITVVDFIKKKEKVLCKVRLEEPHR